MLPSGQSTVYGPKSFLTKSKIGHNIVFEMSQNDHIWYFSQLPHPAMVYFFKPMPFFARKTRNLAYFGQFLLFVANLRTYWCSFTGQDKYMSVMKMVSKWSPISAPLWFGWVQQCWYFSLFGKNLGMLSYAKIIFFCFRGTFPFFMRYHYSSENHADYNIFFSYSETSICIMW